MWCGGTSSGKAHRKVKKVIDSKRQSNDYKEKGYFFFMMVHFLKRENLGDLGKTSNKRAVFHEQRICLLTESTHSDCVVAVRCYEELFQRSLVGGSVTCLSTASCVREQMYNKDKFT